MKTVFFDFILVLINSTLRLPNEQEIGLYSHYSTPMRLVTGEIDPFRRTDLTYKKKISDKFNYTIKLRDVFDTGGFGITTDQVIDSDADNILDQREYLIAEHRRNKKSGWFFCWLNSVGLGSNLEIYCRTANSLREFEDSANCFWVPKLDIFTAICGGSVPSREA